MEEAVNRAYSSTMKMEAICFSKRRFTFTGLHGVIAQKIEFFLPSVERTSKPAY
jgi:hypothetical protein